jgi:hypothetical protein
MARPLRIVEEGGAYHATARGVERRKIFEDALDEREFLRLLAGLEERFGV